MFILLKFQVSYITVLLSYQPTKKPGGGINLFDHHLPVGLIAQMAVEIVYNSRKEEG